jgi:hypothetical protein
LGSAAELRRPIRDGVETGAKAARSTLVKDMVCGKTKGNGWLTVNALDKYDGTGPGDTVTTL